MSKRGRERGCACKLRCTWRPFHLHTREDCRAQVPAVFKVLSMSERNLQEQIRTRARSVCVSLLKTHTHNIKWGRSEMLRSAGVIQRKQQQKDRLETGPLLYYTQQHRGGLIRAHVQERST